MEVKKHMKILVTFLTYGENIFGGIEKSIYNFINGLLKNNVQVVVYTGKLVKGNESTDLKHKTYYSDFLIDTFNAENIDTEILHNYASEKANIEAELLTIIERENPDYILAVDHIAGIIPHIDIFSKTSIPIGIVIHMLLTPAILGNVLSYPFVNLFCASPYIQEELSKTFKDKTFQLLPNCIDDGLIKLTKVEKIKPINIFCNARMAKGKGVDKLIIAFQDISKKYPESKLFLCGGDFHFFKKENFENEIDNFKNDIDKGKIVIFENIPWAEMPKVILEMDFVILPTEMETFGLAALEVLAIGIPLLTTKVGNLKWLLEDYPIHLENNTPVEITQKTIQLFDYNNYDDMIRTGKKIADKYLDINIAKNFIDIVIQK